MNIAVIGAGNGGQAIAGYLAMQGHGVRIYDRSLTKRSLNTWNSTISLTGVLNGSGTVSLLSDHIDEVMQGCTVVLVVTTAQVHKEVARLIAPCLSPGQILVLNPGRTFGALEFRHELRRCNPLADSVVVAETQSLVYACRAESFGNVSIIGLKKRVHMAAYPSRDTSTALEAMNALFGSLVPVENVLITSLENVGAIFHPAMVLFNAAAIERRTTFYFYGSMTRAIAEFLVELDKERLALGTALGLNLMSVEEWLSYAYPSVHGSDLCEKMLNNPAYYKILAPSRIDDRMIVEDVPTGLVPMARLGNCLGVPTPLMTSIIHITSRLVNIDFFATGRDPASLGLDIKNMQAFAETL